MGLLRGIRGWFGRLVGMGSGGLQAGPSFHYLFAHISLRHLALANPLQLLAKLGEDGGREIISVVWEVTAENLGESTLPGFGPEDIVVHTRRWRDTACAVVEMPEPRSMGECHFMAILVDLRKAERLGSEEDVGRYMTLEKGFELSGQPRTVLCEWASDGSHLNYGDGPAPTVEAFVAELRKGE